MKLAFIGTYPPRECGIGIFTNNLFNSILANCEKREYEYEGFVVALSDNDLTYEYPKEVKAIIRQEHQEDYLKAVKFINLSGADICILEHEFGIFGGQNGVQILPLLHRLKVPLIAGADKIWMYYTGIAILILTLFTFWIILRSRIGLFLLAMREDEDGAATRGVDTVRFRLYAFVISSAFAGLAGGFYAHVVGLVSPRMAMLSEMGLILAMSVFGGLESLLGATLGAIVLQTLSEYLRAFTEWRLAIFGALVLFTLRFSPEGLLPRINSLFEDNWSRIVKKSGLGSG